MDAKNGSELFEKLLFDDVIKDLKINRTSTCTFDRDRVIAYALRTLPVEEIDEVENHVCSCPDCLDLVLSIKFADFESQKEALKEVEIPDNIEELIKS